MGVLEARKDAEKITYPVIGENIKDASNVIDYDINDEQTIDQSSVFNANNDTTTGMANVIPGVNSPKLKLSTSIYVDELPEYTVWQQLKGEGGYIDRPDNTSTPIRNMTILESYGTGGFTYYASSQGTLWSGMQAPFEGNYQFEVTYPGSSSTYGWTFQWRTPKGGGSADTIWRTYSTAWNSSDEYETFIRKFDKGEVFMIFATMNRSSSTPFGDSPVVYIKITKI